MKIMKSNEIRKIFLEFFEKNKHTFVESSPVVPQNDPTLLFANAGMNQFKNVFVGVDKRPYTRATSCQKCIRAGGKHNDLDNVGKTPRHHTFFEMLGNFSFGDYFKKEAIDFSWELLVEKLGVPKEHLWITVFEEDDEAETLWKKYMPESRIVRLGKKDNFWEMGNTGPCGPCAEIHIDSRSFFGGCNPSDLSFDDELCLELWNLVFMQFNRHEDGSMEPLPNPSVDTGAGLERIAAILQNKQSNYETDIFKNLLKKVEELSGVKYVPMTPEDTETGMPHRVIADHIRTLAFAISDGAVISNEGRGYVLKRILRRASRYGRRIGIEKPFLTKLLPVLIEEFSGIYPAIKERKNLIENLIKKEEEKFAITLSTGIDLFNNIVGNERDNKNKIISGADAFKLYDTYGFPLDITQDMAREINYEVDVTSFEKELEKQKERARGARKVAGPKLSKTYNEIYEKSGNTKFVGYSETQTESSIIALLDNDGEICDLLTENDEGWMIVKKTPFYGESGGQEGDTGTVSSKNAVAKIINVQRPVHNLFTHKIKIFNGTFNVNDNVNLELNKDYRTAVMRNHTATHLFHAALHKIVSSHATQAGSSVNNKRLRFDFHHHAALTHDEMEEIEKMVNFEIMKNSPVETLETTIEKAKKSGAIMLFDEKYGDTVRLVKIDDYSSELCGGTHVSRTGDIGGFVITNEHAVAAGIRRVEAVCGMEAINEIQRERKILKKAALVTKVVPENLSERINSLIEENKKLSKQLKSAQSVNPADYAEKIISAKKDVAGTNLIIANLGELKADDLRKIGDIIKSKLESYVVVFGAKAAQKCVFLSMVSDDQIKKGKHAGNIIRKVAKIAGGGGGGKPNMAQAGGKDFNKIDEAIGIVEGLLENPASA